MKREVARKNTNCFCDLYLSQLFVQLVFGCNEPSGGISAEYVRKARRGPQRAVRRVNTGDRNAFPRVSGVLGYAR